MSEGFVTEFVAVSPMDREDAFSQGQQSGWNPFSQHGPRVLNRMFRSPTAFLPLETEEPEPMPSHVVQEIIGKRLQA